MLNTHTAIMYYPLQIHTVHKKNRIQNRENIELEIIIEQKYL